ncbi:porin [Oxalobacteraceae bacterium CAVE-383]|nr:porin [Oxalobacteraceae bacterium CAVE-383]
MKKSLLALAVLGSFAAAAQAQTSVTIYGVADAGVFYQSKAGANNNSLFAVNSGGLSGSRLGFKGTEDLGGGLKANFQLEMGYNLDSGSNAQQDGANNSGTLFGRTSTVGLSGGFGSVNVGRQTDFAYSGTAGGMATFSHAGYVNKFSSVDGNTQARLQGERTNNSIRYDMPAFGGLNGGVMFGLGEQAGGGTAGQAWAAGLKYDNGPLAFGGSYYQSKAGTTPADRNLINGGAAPTTPAVVADGGALAGSTATKTYTLGASYNFGFGKLYGNWSRVNLLTGTGSATLTQTFNSGTFGSSSANNKLDLFEIGYNHNLTASLQLLTGYAHTNVSFINGTPQGKLNQIFIGTDYFLSKRTDLYAVGTYIRTSDVTNPLNLTSSSTPTLQAGSTSQGAFGLGVGMRHTF